MNGRFNLYKGRLIIELWVVSSSVELALKLDQQLQEFLKKIWNF